MAADGFTKADGHDLRQLLLERMDSGFSGVHDRLDLLNGRLRAAEVNLGKHDVRLDTLEKRRSAKAERPRWRAISERDIRIVLATIGAAATVAIAIWKVFPLLHRLVTP